MALRWCGRAQDPRRQERSLSPTAATMVAMTSGQATLGARTAQVGWPPRQRSHFFRICLMYVPCGGLSGQTDTVARAAAQVVHTPASVHRESKVSSTRSCDPRPVTSRLACQAPLHTQTPANVFRLDSLTLCVTANEMSMPRQGQCERAKASVRVTPTILSVESWPPLVGLRRWAPSRLCAHVCCIQWPG